MYDVCISTTLAMAGNIVPAIATTNAVVGGIIVMEALNIISSRLSQCKSVRRTHVILFSDVSLLVCADLFKMST